MPTKKKSAKPAAKSRSETADDATFWREVALRSHAEGKREWFRSQLLAWLATLMGEFETVQAELQNDSSDLRKALTHDECSNIYSAIEDCWNALASSAAKPQCVPAFLTAEPVHFPKFATKGGAK